MLAKSFIKDLHFQIDIIQNELLSYRKLQAKNRDVRVNQSTKGPGNVATAKRFY